MSFHPITRREFLKAGAAASVAALTTSQLLPATTCAATVDRPILVVVHLGGGNDGLNTIVPYTSSLYPQLRPQLHIAPETVLPIPDSGVGFHPAMAALKPLFDAGKMAIVQGVGYPGFDRSHFRATDIYGSAEPETRSDSGWLGRYLNAESHLHPMRAVYLGAVTPLMLTAGSLEVPAITDAESYRFEAGLTPADGALQNQAFGEIVHQPATGHSMRDALLARNQSALASIDTVQRAVTQYASPIDYGSDTLAQNLKLAAQLLQSDQDLHIVATRINGFDTHSDQLAIHGLLLTQISTALERFLADMQQAGLSERVVIWVWSEFGRRVAENASSGTDHGTAGPMFLLGDPVAGGLYGPEPDLGNLTMGDLRIGVDFRSIYATLLADWLNMDAALILGGDYDTLPLIK